MDARLDFLMRDIEKDDNSFKTRASIFGNKKYPEQDVRKIWLDGIRHGLEKGLHVASLEGQKIEILANMTNDRHKRFYEDFLKLAGESNCQIQYHPDYGMCIIDLQK
jgi:hypothetical protein